MEPKKFKGQNIVIGDTQPQYKPLPALLMSGKEGEVITCWELTQEEIDEIVANRCLYLSQLTFNNPLQPIKPMANLADNYTLMP